MESEYKAAIDIGSNSILLLVVDKNNQEARFESRITSLGKNLDKTKMFEDESMSDSYKALKEYSKICALYNIDFSDVRITATEASRVATNAPSFFSKLKSQLGANILLISGEEEARLSSQGALFNQSQYLKSNIVTLMDIGGGSTELIKVQVEPFQILDVISLPLGSVRVTDWISDNCWENKQVEISKMINKNIFTTDSLIGVAGTMASLFHMYKGKTQFETTGLNQNTMSFIRLVELFDHWKRDQANPDFFLDKFNFLGKRSKVIFGGYEVCRFICNELGVKDIKVTMQGLVHGSILEIK